MSRIVVTIRCSAANHAAAFEADAVRDKEPIRRWLADQRILHAHRFPGCKGSWAHEIKPAEKR